MLVKKMNAVLVPRPRRSQSDFFPPVIMGDSSTMTIEFLRARLLSERSVSKAAKERSDQLSKTVTELEEQLNIVISQRKKAEKAALEAFSLLRSHGIDDFYEAVSSSSDKDESPSENECNGNLQEEESSKCSEKKEPEFEDALSSSGHGFSTSQGGSLSWKSRSYNRDSEKKLNGRQIRQRMRRLSLMSSMNSSPKYDLGKSCRKIRRREAGSTTEEEGDNGFILDDHSKTDAAKSDWTDDRLNLSAEATGNEPCQREQYDPSTSSFGSGRDEEMERVLEQHANLIGQYEAEEKAQREWEEKYNENKISNLGPVVVEDCSGLAEHTAEPIDELTAIVPYEEKDAKSSSGISSINRELTIGAPIDESTAIVLYDEKEAKSSSGVPSSSREPAAGVQSNGAERLDELKMEFSVRGQIKPIDESNTLAVTHQTRKIQESISEACWGAMRSQVHNIRRGTEGGQFKLTLSAEESATSSPTANQNQDLESESSSSSSFNVHSNAQRILNSPIGVSPLIATPQENASKRGYSSNQDQNFKQSQNASGSLQSVLGALQRAKMSLKQELHKVPSVSQGTWALTTVPEARTTIPDKTIEVPFGSAGLFRLPTDTFPQAQKPRSFNYGTGSSLISSYPRLGYHDSIPDNCSATNAYSKYGYGNSMTKYFESYRSDIGLPNSDRFPEPCSDLPDDRTVPNKPGISVGKQYFRFGTSLEDTVTGISSSSFPVHTDVKREASQFSTGFMNSQHSQHGGYYRFGSQEPAYDVYSRRYSDLQTERKLHDELPKHQIDWMSGMSSSDRYSLYSGHGI